LEIQFSDYAAYMDEKKKSGLYDEQYKFYESMFDDEYEILSIPMKDDIIMNGNSEAQGHQIRNGKETGKGQGMDFDGNRYNRSVIINGNIGMKETDKIESYIKENRISKTAFFLSIYWYIMNKYSEQSNIYTSIISINRNNHYTENMICMFVKYSTTSFEVPKWWYQLHRNN